MEILFCCRFNGLECRRLWKWDCKNYQQFLFAKTFFSLMPKLLLASPFALNQSFVFAKDEIKLFCRLESLLYQ